MDIQLYPVKFSFGKMEEKTQKSVWKRNVTIPQLVSNITLLPPNIVSYASSVVQQNKEVEDLIYLEKEAFYEFGMPLLL